jgi:hypothetical protein
VGVLIFSLLVLVLAALFFFAVLAVLWIVRVLARILGVGALFLFPRVLTLLPLLVILLLVLLALFGFGSRHCIPPSTV